MAARALLNRYSETREALQSVTREHAELKAMVTVKAEELRVQSQTGRALALQREEERRLVAHLEGLLQEDIGEKQQSEIAVIREDLVRLRERCAELEAEGESLEAATRELSPLTGGCESLQQLLDETLEQVEEASVLLKATVEPLANRREELAARKAEHEIAIQQRSYFAKQLEAVNRELRRGAAVPPQIPAVRDRVQVERDPRITQLRAQVKALAAERDQARALLNQATRDSEVRLNAARSKAMESATKQLGSGAATNRDFQRLVQSLMEAIAEKEELLSRQRADSQLLGETVQRLEARLRIADPRSPLLNSAPQ
jgi:hypothetical protein